MFRSNGNHWGWGFHIDLNGNLRDAFPRSGSKNAENKEAAPVKKQAKWHVKKHVKKALAGAR